MKKIVFVSNLAFNNYQFERFHIQKYIDMRRYDPVDMYFDYLGLSIGMIVVLLYKYVKKT